MKIITCTGFYGTGSSAITDLFMDCKNVACKGDYEIRLLHDPYGVSDLEYNLIDNPNRHNTSNAIKKFKWNIDFLSGNTLNKKYEAYFDNKFKSLSYKYIDDICEFKYFGKWHWDVVERGKLFWIADRSYNKILTILEKIFHLYKENGHDLLPKNEMAYAGVMDRDVFYKMTQNYIDKLLDIINKEKKEYVFVDQLVPPSNFKRYNNYVNNLNVIVVDRDPRDIFILEKEIWHGHVVPCYDIDKFCDWFIWTRKMFEHSGIPENVIKIQFEDLIYNYETTIEQIFKFVGIDKINYTANHFIPEKSKKNTRLWKQYPQYENEISKIESRLHKYCYIEK